MRLQSSTTPSASRFTWHTLLAVLLSHWAVQAHAIEEPDYRVQLTEDSFEVRDYGPRIVAEARAAATFENAGDEAFNRLFRYIDGNNEAGQKIAMTAPVSQDACIENPATGDSPCWTLSFTMPAEHTLGTLPAPSDPSVDLRELPPARYAVVKYSGFWSESAFLRHRQRLESWMSQRDLTPSGAATWARYNPPFMPWFMRRNEILIPIAPS